MTREKEKLFLFLKLRFVTLTYIGHLQKRKALGWELYTLQRYPKLSSTVRADNLMGQEKEQTLSWKDVCYSYCSALS